MSLSAVTDETTLTIYPWVVLESVLEVEAWMELNNQELQKLIGTKPSMGQGICFYLAHGGEIYFHTNSEGDVLLDVSEEAQWVNPVISACTGSATPRGRIWLLPHDVLLQLIWGLNTLITASQLVLRHSYRL